jgi:6,7-dimethyl-8-ribityllumazine synthase
MDKPRASSSYKFEQKPHVLIVEGRYHEDIGRSLLEGAHKVLEDAGATHEVMTVPGAFEIPAAIAYAVKALDFDAGRRRFDGYIALGCVIEGETRHHEVIGNESLRGLQEIALRYALAIGNGILTCATEAQAKGRADPKKKDRGGAAAAACLRMVEIKHSLRLSPKKRWVAR